MTTFHTTRDIPASKTQVYAAFAPERLARWWGPAGFRNTFSVCEFKTGGAWVFTMHGPDGTEYANESVFAEVVPDKRVVVRHVCEPYFTLTMELEAIETATGAATRVSWTQVFDDAELAGKVAHIVQPANEENLDRWTQEVLDHQL